MGAKWTEEQNEALRVGVANKTRIKTTAKQIGRTPWAVTRQMMRLGLRLGNGAGEVVHSETFLPQATYTQARALAAARGLRMPDFIRSLVEKELAQQ